MNRSDRIEFVDLLRGVAVMAMFFVHTVSAWLAPEYRAGLYWRYSMNISGMVAPVFVFLAGVSVAIYAKRNAAAGGNPKNAQRRIARRGLQIFLVGYGLHLTFFLLSFMSGSWQRVFKVDILHCIGLSLFLLTKIAWPGSKTRFNWTAAVLFLALPVLAWGAYRLPLEEWLPFFISPYLTTKSPLALFPLVPYATWLALGLFVGPIWLDSMDTPKRELRFWQYLVVTAVSMFAMGEMLEFAYSHYSFQTLWLDTNESPVQTRGLVHLFWIKAAFVLVLFAVARVTTPVLKKKLKRPLLFFGRESLFAYCTHLIMVYSLLGRFFIKRIQPVEHVVSALVLTLMMYCFVLIFDYLRLKRRRINIAKLL